MGKSPEKDREENKNPICRQKKVEEGYKTRNYKEAANGLRMAVIDKRHQIVSCSFAKQTFTNPSDDLRERNTKSRLRWIIGTQIELRDEADLTVVENWTLVSRKVEEEG